MNFFNAGASVALFIRRTPSVASLSGKLATSLSEGYLGMRHGRPRPPSSPLLLLSPLVLPGVQGEDGYLGGHQLVPGHARGAIGVSAIGVVASHRAVGVEEVLGLVGLRVFDRN